MYPGHIPLQRRTEIAGRLRRLGKLKSYFEFCRVLASGGVTLDVVEYNITDYRHQLAMSTAGVIKSFCEFGLAVELAQWFRRWDQVAYSVPLNKNDLTFLVARERWMRVSDWELDLPGDRWPEFHRIAVRAGLEGTAAAISGLFYYDLERHALVDGVAAVCGITASELHAVLGPYGGSTAHAT